ncbi:NUDIX domain-containing protein [Stutzerimonas marianensis]
MNRVTVVSRVAAAVVYRDGNILITRLAPGEKLAGMWEFPGGKLESEETPQSCIFASCAKSLASIRHRRDPHHIRIQYSVFG